MVKLDCSGSVQAEPSKEHQGAEVKLNHGAHKTNSILQPSKSFLFCKFMDTFGIEQFLHLALIL